jgi:outer membrane immunogenic protein
MKKPPFALLALATTMIASTAALAAPFDGPYVGIQAGLSRDKIGGAGTDLGGVTKDESQSSLSGGLFAGYDVPIGHRVVVGGELGLQASANDAISATAGGETVVLDPKRQIDATARVGYLLDPSLFVYARGGYTNVRARTSSGPAASGIGRTKDVGGWTLGAGVERKLTSTVSARAEYRYASFSQDQALHQQEGLVGLAYHF